LSSLGVVSIIAMFDHFVVGSEKRVTHCIVKNATAFCPESDFLDPLDALPLAWQRGSILKHMASNGLITLAVYGAWFEGSNW